MKIGNKIIGREAQPFIIAEMSGNHNQSLDRAFEIVDAAAKAGAHAIKLQTYTAETITLDIHEGEFYIEDKNSLWQGNSLHSLYKNAYTPWEWHEAIFDRANKNGLICFSTPFDETAVDFLETLHAPAYKIASFEIVHLPLIKKVASTGKPIIISTGMSSVSEIEDAVRTVRSTGNENLVLLKCTSSYPSSPTNSNILTIPHLRDMFNCEIGLSDHSMGVGVATAAVAHGATVVEKHFTLRRSDGGVDSAFSLEPEEMEALVVETERAWQSLGRVNYGPVESEKKSLVFRRSIYIAEDVNEGDILTVKNMKCVRPGLGLPPKFYEMLLGKKLNRSLKKGTPMSWDFV